MHSAADLKKNCNNIITSKLCIRSFKDLLEICRGWVGVSYNYKANITAIQEMRWTGHVEKFVNILLHFENL